MTLEADDPDSRMRTLAEAAETLLAALADETAALAERQPARFREATASKLAAAAAYEQAVRAMHQQDADGRRANSAARDGLAALGRRIEAAVAENRMRLDVARTAQARLVGHIVEAVSALDAGPGTYGAAGVVSTSSRGSAAPSPVSFCRAI